jgi:GNAT superfamily N-acetyltransferase
MYEGWGMDIAIRQAEDGDAPACAEVHVEGWALAYRDTPLRDHLVRRSPEDRASIWTKLLADHASGKRLWVATKGGDVVGLVAAGPGRAGAPDAFDVYALYQRASVLGTGVAKMLLDHAVADARSRAARTFGAWSLVENRAASAFYERCGWTALGERTTDHEGSPIVERRYECML